ncbi:MAG: transposase [Promethearchaeota archaeon Loki_b31]|nr:MAG: transposase [Candidatus Lokiarchaeota archaeon Loki_b31]
MDKTFGSCRFIYNKMLEERKKVYQELKDDKEAFYDHKYKTERQYKQDHSFLKEVDSKALQSEWRHLKSAYDNFFRNIKKGIKKGFPKFKSKKNRQSYTTYNVNNNCKIDFENKKLKLPKIKTWVKYRDDRIFSEYIKHITVSKTKTRKYFASVLIEIESNVIPKQVVKEDKIIGFDMSASKFLIAKELKLSSPRFYRKEEPKLIRLHREASRKEKGSSNRNRARINLARLYEKIENRKRDWIHKITHLLSNHFDCVILEDLNVKGMQRFNSGLSKSVSLDFSWNQFVTIMKYKMEQKGKHLILVDRYFPSSKLCSECGYKKEDLELSDREWVCPKSQITHDRDVNASVNLRNEGIRNLKENNITIINNNETTVGTTVDAFGENVRLLDQRFKSNSR